MQTVIVNCMGVNNNSFNKFMSPKTYKDQWSAVQNGMYWAAAHLLEKAKHDAKTTKASKKRKAVDGMDASDKRSKSDAKAKVEQLMLLVNQVELPSIVPVYDSCPEVVKKVC